MQLFLRVFFVSLLDFFYSYYHCIRDFLIRFLFLFTTLNFTSLSPMMLIIFIHFLCIFIYINRKYYNMIKKILFERMFFSQINFIFLYYFVLINSLPHNMDRMMLVGLQSKLVLDRIPCLFSNLHYGLCLPIVPFYLCLLLHLVVGIL